MAEVTVSKIMRALADQENEMFGTLLANYDANKLIQIGNAITADESMKNTFCDALFNRIGFVDVKQQVFHDPFEILKGQEVIYGDKIQELMVNPAVDVGFDNDTSLLLKTSKPDGKAAYYGLNRKGCFPVTVTDAELNAAFASESAFMQFYNTKIASMFSGDSISEFMLIKRMLAKNIDAGNIHIVECDIKTDPKDVAKKISEYSTNFQFPSTEYNGYNKVNADKIAGGERKAIVWTPLGQQVIIKSTSTKVELDYEVLACQFQRVSDINAHTIPVDIIPSADYEVYAVLCDAATIKLHDAIFKMKSQDIGSSLTRNYWLHHWQYYYLSLFGNCVVFARKLTDVEKEKASVVADSYDKLAKTEQESVK